MDTTNAIAEIPEPATEGLPEDLDSISQPDTISASIPEGNNIGSPDGSLDGNPGADLIPAPAKRKRGRPRTKQPKRDMDKLARDTAKRGTRNASIAFRRQDLVNALPHHGWNITKAALSLGYSRDYAVTKLPKLFKTDSNLSRMVEAKRREVDELAPWGLEDLCRQYRKLLASCDEAGDRTNAKGCLDSLTRIQGGFTDRQLTEDVNESRRLEAQEREEAARIADIVVLRKTG